MKKDTIVIENGEEAIIKRIYQWHSYGGLLEGLPNDRFNKIIISNAKTEAKELLKGLKEICIIKPTQTPIPFDGEYAFGKPMSLPSIICVAELHCNAVFRDTSKMFSALGVIWFQDEYAFPVADHILQQIKEIPFSKLCGEFDY